MNTPGNAKTPITESEWREQVRIAGKGMATFVPQEQGVQRMLMKERKVK